MPGSEAFFKPPPQPRFKKLGKSLTRRLKENKELNKLKINHCEIRLSGCWGKSHLTWAHSKKVKHLVTSKDWQEAARACLYCHHEIGKKPKEEEKRIVLAAIARRPKHAHTEDP